MVRNKNEPQKGINSGITTNHDGSNGSSLKQTVNGKLSSSDTPSSTKSKEQKQNMFLKSGSFMKIGPKMSAKDLSVRVNHTPCSNNLAQPASTKLNTQMNGFDKDHFEKQVNCDSNCPTDNGTASILSTLQDSNHEINHPKNILTKVEPSNQILHASHLKSQAFIYKRMFCVYREGQNVLTRWSDGLYYLGKICKVNIVLYTNIVFYPSAKKPKGYCNEHVCLSVREVFSFFAVQAAFLHPTPPFLVCRLQIKSF